MRAPKSPDTPQEPKKHKTVGKTLTYIFSVILLVIIVIAFVGTPAVGGIAAGSRISFGSYAGREITYEPGNFLARQYQGIARQVQQEGREVTELLIQQVWRTAFQRAVYHEALQVLANEANVAVSDRAIDRAIAQWPEFQENGRFSPSAYQATPSQARFALRQYLRGVLVSEKVENDLYGAVTTSNAERDFIVGMAGPERRFRFVQFALTDYPESELVAYGEANEERFRRMDLSVISIGTSESDAQRIREQAVTRQASFEDLARSHSRDVHAEDGGDMGRVYYHELEPDFEDPSVIEEIFALEPGEISRVLRTTFGWAIYRADELPIAPDFSDSSVLAEIRRYMNTFERGRVEDYLRDRAQEFASRAREDGFSVAAAAVDQSPQLTEYFPVNYGNLPYFGTARAQANEAIASAAFREDFFRTLFSLPPDGVSDPIVIRDYVVVFQVDDERPVDEDTAEFLDFYLTHIVREFTQQQAQAVVVDEDKLVDNFTRTYNRAILGQ